MQVFVKTLAGNTITLNIEKNENIDSIKEKIKLSTGIEPAQQKLFYGGKQLNQGTIQEYDIQNESTLHLVIRLIGGTFEKLQNQLFKKQIFQTCFK